MIERRSQIPAKRRKGALPLWAWPTVLSLDAPLVAITWQWLFASSYGVDLAWVYPTVLGSSVWLIYVGDRLLDGLSLDLNKHHTYRHAFYVRYHSLFTLLWLSVFVLTTVLALNFLTPRDLLLGLGLACAVALYMLGTHFFKVLSLSKEPLVGLVFAVAVVLPVWGVKASMALGYATLLLAALAYLNCLLIAFWEREADTDQNQLSSLRRVPKLARALTPTLVSLSLLSLASGLIVPLSLALSVTAGALFLLFLKAYNLDAERRRVLADAALLIPLLFLAFV